MSSYDSDDIDLGPQSAASVQAGNSNSQRREAGSSSVTTIPLTTTSSNSEVRAVLHKITGRVHAFQSSGFKATREEANREAEQGRTGSVSTSYGISMIILIDLFRRILLNE